jgi:transposase
VHAIGTFLLRKPMRGKDDRSEILFSYIRLDERIPADHPLRVIRQLVDSALAELSRAFVKLYARDGRPSIPPERLLRALLLQAFYTVRSELQLMEQLNYDLLFRWLVGLSADDPVWDATVFCKNRDRLLNGDIARKFMISELNLPEVRQPLSSEHFSVEGTLIEAWASMKSFVPKEGSKPPPGKGQDGSGGRNAERNFHGEKRKNDTHSSTTYPDARLFRKGAGMEAKLCHRTSASRFRTASTRIRWTRRRGRSQADQQARLQPRRDGVGDVYVERERVRLIAFVCRECSRGHLHESTMGKKPTRTRGTAAACADVSSHAGYRHFVRA